MNLIDKILEEWAYRVHDGMPNPKNPLHLVHLEETLNELNLPRKVSEKLLQNLRRIKEVNPKNRGASDIWKTAAGNYRSTNPDGEAQSWGKDKDKAEKWRTGELKDIPKKDKSEKDKSEKDKSLRDDANPINDFNNKKEFTKTGIPDDTTTDPETGEEIQGFNDNPNIEKNSEKDFKFSPEQVKELLGEPLQFPKRYIKALERLMSTKFQGDISITDVMKDVGAGELQAQSGEILTMMGSTIKDSEKAKEFFNMLREHARNADKPIITEAWIDSAEKVRGGIFKRLDAKYGEGNWEITSSSWDVKSEVESLGMKDYNRDKGFSTDMYLVINGEDIDEISLKKTLDANLLNATTGRVLDIIIQGNAPDEELERYNELRLKKKKSKEEKQKLQSIEDKYKKSEYGWDEGVDVKQAQQRQRQLHDETLSDDDFISEVKGDRELTDEEVKEIAYPMGISQNQKDRVADFIKNDVPKLLETIEPPITRDKIKSALIELGIKNKPDARAVGKAAVILMKIAAKKNPKSKAAKGLKKTVENSRGHSKSVAKLIINSPEVRKGLMKSIREALPLSSLISGEESMHLGNQALDQEILSTIFRVSSMDELVQGLTLNKEGDAIVYQVDVVDPKTGKKTKEDIPIATVTNRPDGVAYGETWKLEFKVHSQFKKTIKSANEVLGRI